MAAVFSGEQLPVKKAISEHFAVGNKIFISVNGPSWPNHNFAQSATSCGAFSNVFYNRCNGTTAQVSTQAIKKIYARTFVSEIDCA